MILSFQTENLYFLEAIQTNVPNGIKQSCLEIKLSFLRFSCYL